MATAPVSMLPAPLQQSRGTCAAPLVQHRQRQPCSCLATGSCCSAAAQGAMDSTAFTDPAPSGPFGCNPGLRGPAGTLPTVLSNNKSRCKSLTAGLRAIVAMSRAKQSLGLLSHCTSGRHCSDLQAELIPFDLCHQFLAATFYTPSLIIRMFLECAACVKKAPRSPATIISRLFNEVSRDTSNLMHKYPFRLLICIFISF